MAAITAALAACAVGPNFKPPGAPPASAYTQESVPSETTGTDVRGGESQHLQLGADLPGEWWTLFRSSQLNTLVTEAIASYPDIAAQQAALRVARDNVAGQRGIFFPQVQGSANYQRESVSGASIGPGFPGFITNIFQASVNISYTFDVFGGERRALEGLRAQQEAQNFQLEASYLTLTANVATTFIQIASLRDQVTATLEIVDTESKQLDFIKRRFEVGAQTRADILQQESNLALVRATLPGLQQQRLAAEHALAVLTGRRPDESDAPTIALSDLTLPVEVPVALPSSLVAQRPDIRMQEALLHQASASIGVATANMLPQLTLSGAVGDESTTFSSLLKPEAGIWNVGAAIAQPLFQGGTLRAKRRAAIDTYDQAGAQYRLAVLKAFQNVADVLTALATDADALKEQHAALNAAQQSLDLIRRQFDSGAVNYVSLLTAQQTYQQAKLAYVQALARRYTDTVTLFQALGGGWWNRSDAGTDSIGTHHL
jgi:NodT family efflux transporter outer membrane factor (OMF) lipoprotein